MEKIYAYDWDLSAKICRSFPQVYQYEGDYDFDQPNSIYRFSYETEKPFSEKINYPIFKREKSGIPSDFMSHSFGGFLMVSDKFRKVMQKLDLPPYILDPIQVKWKGGYLDGYYAFSIFEEKFSKMKFEKMKFQLDYPIENRKEPIHFDTFDDLKSFDSETIGKLCSVEFVEMHAYREQVPDIFSFPPLSNDWCFTEKAKKIIEEAGVNGLLFKEVKFPVYFY